MCKKVQHSDVFCVLSGKKLCPASRLLLSPVNLPVLDITWLPTVSLQPLLVMDRKKPEGAGNRRETSAAKSPGYKKRKGMENERGRREDLMRKKIIELQAFVFPPLFLSRPF